MSGGEAMDMVKVVTQRMVSAKLLINAAEDIWASVGRGLVFHVSFTKSCPEDKNLKPICKSLLTSSLSTAPTAGGWQEDHSDADSIIGICKKGQNQSILIIPQASLTTKLVPGDKYLKYHHQCEKSKAELLYIKFQRELKVCVKELLGKEDPGPSGKKVDVSDWKSKERAKQNVILTAPPERYFIDGALGEIDPKEFGSFDEKTGYPLTDAEGNELAKSRRKKLDKLLEKYVQKWKKQEERPKEELAKTEADCTKLDIDGSCEIDGKKRSLESPGCNDDGIDGQKISNGESTNEQTKEEETDIDLSKLELADETFVVPEIVAGTFGGRQGLELISSGPFTHAFSFP